MSVIASALKHMLAAGMPADAIIAAVAEMEANLAHDPVAEKRRAYDRERKRAERAEEKVARQNLSTGHPVESTDKADNSPFPAPAPFLPPHPQQTPTPTHTPERNTPARKADDFPKPEWADPQVWADFMLNRKRKRMTNSATAYRGFLRDIEKHTDADWPPGRLLEHATAKGWASINAPEDQDHRNELSRRTAIRPAQQKSSRAARLFETMRAADAERGDLGDYPPTGRSLSAERWNQ